MNCDGLDRILPNGTRITVATGETVEVRPVASEPENGATSRGHAVP